MRALSIRQPYAELILRGIKRIEFRSRPTKIIGERFHIYASKKPVVVGFGGFDKLTAGKLTAGGGRLSVVKDEGIWSNNLSTADEGAPPWMVELATALKLFGHDLPTGVIVGSAVIESVSQRKDDGMYQWHLTDVQRAGRLRKPKGRPQPVWFTAF